MKTTATKTNFKLGLIGLGLTLAGSPLAQAQVTLEYPGGPHSQVSPAQMEALRGWSRNAQAEIDRLLNKIQPILDSSDKKRMLFTRMETIVQNSEPRSADLLLRHAIYAGLTVNKLIEQQTVARGRDFTPQGTVDQQVRVLRRSLEIAREYYESDAAYINGILTQRKSFTNPRLVEFGVKFSQFLIKMSDGLMSAPANYGMIRWSLGILTNYMAKDDRNVAFASTIKHLNDELRNYPDIVNGQEKPDDAKCVKYVRELKRLAQEAYAEINQTKSNIVAPVATVPEIERPAAVSQVQNEPERVKTVTGTERDANAEYPFEQTGSQRLYYVSIPQSPVRHVGAFKSKPVSIRLNNEVVVFGIGTDDQVYYLSSTLPNPRMIQKINLVVKVYKATSHAGLAAIVYADEYGHRITLNTAGQNRTD